MSNETPHVTGAQVVSRVSALLRELASNNRLGSRLVDLERKLGLERSTAHRLLRALVQDGLAEQDENTKRYHLGPLIFELGIAVKPTLDLRAFTRDALERLTNLTGDTVYLTIRNRYESVCIARLEGDFPIKTLTVDVGGRRPLGTNAGGLALLAAESADEIDRILAWNAAIYPNYYGLTSEKVGALVNRAHTLGYVLSDNDILPGATALGLPLLAPDRTPLAAISVVAVQSRMPPARREQIVRAMKDEILKLESQLATTTPRLRDGKRPDRHRPVSRLSTTGGGGTGA